MNYKYKYKYKYDKYKLKYLKYKNIQKGGEYTKIIRDLIKDKSYQITLDKNDTLLQFKQKFAKKTHIPLEKQRIIYYNNILDDNNIVMQNLQNELFFIEKN
jgi:hypothetical protein